MCKALTLQLHRCRNVPRDGNEYCGHHTMIIPDDGHDHNANNLAEICNRVRARHFDRNLELLPGFSTEISSEAVRRYIFDDMMPFLRDCWRMGIRIPNFSQATLSTHYPVIGQAGHVEIPPRVMTPEERQTESRNRIRQYHQRQFQQVRHLIRQQEIRQNEEELPAAQPFNGRLQRMNAENIDAGAFAVAAAAIDAVHHIQGHNGLPAIANDSQSVHRTSVNESVMASIEVLTKIPWRKESWPILHEDQTKFPGGRKLFEHIFLWSDIYTKKESKEMYPKLLALTEKNYISGIVNMNDVVYGTKLWIVLYKIIQWTFERPHEEQKEIFKRMLEECFEGRDMCIQGKLARFVNILSGFHPDVKVGLSGKELLQERMARLAQREEMDSEKRIEEGRDILRDASVPEVEWDAWLEPLLLF